MWKIYHDLIEGIPPEIEVTKVFIGEHWVYVNAKDTYTLYTGVAMNVCGGRIQRDLENPEGKTLKELAQFSQSWNFLDASIGMAAMNAYYNYPSVVEKCGICPEENYNRTGFDVFSHEITGKKVASFAFVIESRLAISVLSRKRLLPSISTIEGFWCL